MTREEAIKALTIQLEYWEQLKEKNVLTDHEGNNAVDVLKTSIEALQAEPVKHGKWIEAEWVDLNDWTTWRECSCCGEGLSKYVKGFGRRDFPQLNYCPNCGAKMDK